MSLSFFVVCLNFILVAHHVAALKKVPLVSDGLFSKKGNVKRLTPAPLSMEEEGLDDTLDEVVYFDETDAVRRGKKNTKVWDHWGKWSPCSVTCGVGKMVRWRHCVSDGCAPGEKEAQIKTCTLSPCE